ncbi:MAG: YafY family transcriptional regulator [Saprospiraceae bacterium]|nr:YafY family transcriptional regulator [Saprospiraceae bacterium]
MNRIDRLSAIITQLQSKRLITANEIASRFNISLRTVYRDIRALVEAGIPIIGEAGFGYSITEGYRLPPVMFTKEEAMALLMAEKIVQSVTDQHNSDQIRSAMYKIKAVLRTTEKDILKEIDDNIAVKPPRNSLIDNNLSNLLQRILTSIAEQKIINIEYTTLAKEESSVRNVEPVGIYYANEQWYLIGYCQLRSAYRTFRADRIFSINQIDKSFDRRHPSLKIYLNKIEKKEKLVKVVLHIDKSVAIYFKEEKYNQGLVLEQDLGEVIEMTFMVSSTFGIARWFMKMADHAVIIEPPTLINHVLEMAHKLLLRQNKS